MKKKLQYIFLFLSFFIIVAIMYIGGLKSDLETAKVKDSKRPSHNSFQPSILPQSSSIESNISYGSKNKISHFNASSLSNDVTEEREAKTGIGTSLRETQPSDAGDHSNVQYLVVPASKSANTNTSYSHKSTNKKSSVSPSTLGHSEIKSHTKNKKSSAGAGFSSISSSDTRTDSSNTIIDRPTDTVYLSEEPNNQNLAATMNNENIEKTADDENGLTLDETLNSNTEESNLPETDDINAGEQDDEILNTTEAESNDEDDLYDSDAQETDDLEKDNDEKVEPENTELTNLEKAKVLAKEGGLDSFLEITDMVETSDDALEQRQLIQIASTMSDSLSPEILFEVLKVSTSPDMLKMAVVTLAKSSSPVVIELAVENYHKSSDSVEKDYLIDVIVQADSPAMIESLSTAADKYSYDTPIGKAALNTMAIIGTPESTENLLSRFNSTENESAAKALTSSIAKVHSKEALPVLIKQVNTTDNTQEIIAIIKALGNYSAKDVSSTLDNIYSKKDVDLSIKYEIDKTYEKISK